MSELRIPREDERKEIEKIYECVEKECIHVEALLSVSYTMFKTISIPRVRCSKGNYFLFEDSRSCKEYIKK